MYISIFHNIMWSKYKGGVFSALNTLTCDSETKFFFTQIAETDSDRVGLSGVDLSYHQYPYELIFKGRYSSIRLYRRVMALMTRAWHTRADLVVIPGYDKPEYWAMLLTLVARRKPRAVFCDSTAYDRSNSLLRSLAKRMFFSMCDGFFGYGERSRQYLIMHGVDPKRIFFRCQAAALPKDYTEESAISRRLSYAADFSSRPRFLYVGRLSHEKGLDTLLRCFPAVIDKYASAKLIIVGAGPLQEDLELLRSRLNLTDHVQFVGALNGALLAEQYAAATALVLPSTSEPWGLVVNEALSAGCPVIVSNACGCVPELVIEERTGLSVQTNSVADLTDKLLSSVNTFSNVELIAYECIKHMRQFTPHRAALQIVEGCSSILSSAIRPLL